MKRKVLCIVQARNSSKRLPNKLLYKIRKHTLLEHLLFRLKKLNFKRNLIIATTTNKKDLSICKIAKRNNITFYRGSEKNVLNRFYECSKKYQGDIIIRITADCPLIDVIFVKKLLNFFKKNDYDYVNNIDINCLPDGFSCEIFSFQSLEIANRLVKRNFDKEHVTPFIWTNPKRFKIAKLSFRNEKRLIKKVRLTLDYKEDLNLIEKVIDNLYLEDKCFSLKKILIFLQKNKHLLNLNKKHLNLQTNKFHKKRNAFFKGKNIKF
jgi:spore coat polysaccharide biosynthesis protein SpsF